jgi:hypothetical protein
MTRIPVRPALPVALLLFLAAASPRAFAQDSAFSPPGQFSPPASDAHVQGQAQAGRQVQSPPAPAPVPAPAARLEEQASPQQLPRPAQDSGPGAESQSRRPEPAGDQVPSGQAPGGEAQSPPPPAPVPAPAQAAPQAPESQSPAGGQPPKDEPAREEPPAQAVKRNIGGGDGVSVVSPDGNYSLQLGIIGQFRFRVYDHVQVRRTSRTIVSPPIPVEDIGQVERSFNIRLLRVYLKGNAFCPWLTYKLETDMAANDEGLREVFIPQFTIPAGGGSTQAVLIRAGAEDLDGRSVKIVDFYLDGAPRKFAGFRLGQFKIPFGRQELVPDHLLQMPERSIALNFFAPGRDRGMVFKGESPDSKIGYQAGVFNGNGIDQAQNTDDTLAYGFRLTGTAGGPYLDIESIVDNPESFHAQGGASWYDSTRRTTSTGDPILSVYGDIEENRLSADLEFFWPKANLLLEYFQGNIRTDDTVFQRMQTICFGAYLKGVPTCHQNGFNVQGGFLLAERHEISGRYSQVDPDRDLERDKLLETTLNYTYYFKKHALRWSTSLTALTLQVNAPGSSSLAVQQGDESIPTVSPFPDPEGFVPTLKDERNKLLITQLQWMF